MEDKERKFVNNLTEEQVERFKEGIRGLTKSQWGILSSSVNYRFNQKASKIELEGSIDLDSIEIHLL